VFLQKLLPHLTPFRLLAHYWINGVWHLDLRARQRSAACPGCRHRSTAVHSSYRRTVADVPITGTQVLIHLQVRRFFCRHAACLRCIFAERFPTLVPVRGRHMSTIIEKGPLSMNEKSPTPKVRGCLLQGPF
jgi:zinc-finger of transposase IS204/IS1001/IS1096/IS1165